MSEKFKLPAICYKIQFRPWKPTGTQRNNLKNGCVEVGVDDDNTKKGFPCNRFLAKEAVLVELDSESLIAGQEKDAHG